MSLSGTSIACGLRIGLFLAGVFLSPTTSAAAAPASASEHTRSDLTELSLEELMNIKVTSVSKRAEPRSEAAAAITVITGNEIRRSGATTFPEVFRMAPGVHVGRVDSNVWAIGVRGFSSGNSSKLLVLMDGRSLYTPLFSGVFWDVQDTNFADLDRVEIIRGPGGTLWGANAMNGVINITTKSARETHGVLLDGGGGTEERAFGTVRYGGQIGDSFHYRVYGKYVDRGSEFSSSGPATDAWHSGHLGFRSDWDWTAADAITFQGDYYDGTIGLLHPSFRLGASPSGPPGDVSVSGGNVLGRWSHRFSENSDLVLQAYYDRTNRRDPVFDDFLNTYDVDLQRRLPLSWDQDLIVGASYRLMSDDFPRGQVVSLVPARSNDQLLSGFVQDQISFLRKSLRLTLGTKLEHNDFSGLEVQPSGRIAWDPVTGQTLWGAISRAVRTPTRLERDIFGNATDPTQSPVVRLLGTHDFAAEELLAYELGYRTRLTPEAFIDVATFYNDYDRLETFELGHPFTEGTPPSQRTVVPIINGNKLDGQTYGFEVAADWAIVAPWRLAASYSFLKTHFNLDAGSRDLNKNLPHSDSSPQNQVAVRSFLDLPARFEFDVMFRYVDRLVSSPSGEATPSYFNLDTRLGWRGLDAIDIALVGQNLLQEHHREFSNGTEIERGVYGRITWQFAHAGLVF